MVPEPPAIISEGAPELQQRISSILRGSGKGGARDGEEELVEGDIKLGGHLKKNMDRSVARIKLFPRLILCGLLTVKASHCQTLCMTPASSAPPWGQVPSPSSKCSSLSFADHTQGFGHI